MKRGSSTRIIQSLNSVYAEKEVRGVGRAYKMQSNKNCSYNVTVVVGEAQDKKRVEIQKHVIEVKGSNNKARKSGSVKFDKSGKKPRRSNSPRSGGAHGGGGTNGKVPATRSKCVK